MALDVTLADRLQRGRLPARCPVLVDDHRSYSLIKVMPLGEAASYSEFRTHALVEIKDSAAPEQRQGDLEAGRRLSAQQGRRGVGKGRIRAISGGPAAGGFGVEG